MCAWHIVHAEASASVCCLWDGGSYGCILALGHELRITNLIGTQTYAQRIKERKTRRTQMRTTVVSTMEAPQQQGQS